MIGAAKPRINFTRRAVAIYEVGRCESWKVEGLNGYVLDAVAPTAVAALALVKERDGHDAESVGAVMTTIGWHYRTGIGRLVVCAITGEK
jgi:hypothetical protein